MMCLYVDGCFFLYISGRVTVHSEFLPFIPFVFLLMNSNNRTSFDTSAYYTNGVILFKYDDDFDDDADDDDDGGDQIFDVQANLR